MAVAQQAEQVSVPARLSAPPRSRKQWRNVREQLSAFSFVAPAMILLSVFLLYPIGYVVWLSFHQWRGLGDPQYIGLDNYQFLRDDARFLRAIVNTVFFVVLAVPAQMALGLYLAVLLNDALRGRRLFRTIFFVPMAVSMAAAGLLFRWLFTQQPIQGFVPNLLDNVGIDFPNWQTESGIWAMIVVVLMNTWKATGYAMVVYLAGLQSISADVYEAAALDGVQSGWRKFKDITYPLLTATTFLLVVTTTIFSFRAFEPFFIMTAGGPTGDTTTIVYYVYEKFPNRVGIASGAATLMLIGVFMLTAVQFLINRRRETYY